MVGLLLKKGILKGILQKEHRLNP